ncbi:MAG: DUF1189 family protein [Cyanobacteria bacterium P01_D01_bin.123]
MRFYRAFFLSFFSQSLYREVAKFWRGTGFTYLFILQAICLLAIIFRLNADVGKFVRAELPPILAQIPTITVENGVASTPEDKAYSIVYPKDNALLAVIDTTGSITSLDETESDILVTREEVMVRNSSFETRSLSFQGIDSARVDRSSIDGFISIFQSVLPYIIYPFSVIWYFLYRIVQVLIYASIGYVTSRGQEPTLSYATIVRMVSVAVTPVLLFEAALRLIGLAFPPYWGFLGIFVVLGYVYFAVQAQAEISTSA